MNFFAEIEEGLFIAWDAIRANKMRSALTTLGIIIGIVTVTLMGTAIDGINRAFRDSISIVGADVLYVVRFSWQITNNEEWMSQVKRPTISMPQVRSLQRRENVEDDEGPENSGAGGISMAQVNYLESQFHDAQAIAPVVYMGQIVKYKKLSTARVQIFGSTDKFLATSGFSMAEGRFISPLESAAGRPVCVIGNDVKTNLFPEESPLGKKVFIGPRRLEVIGVLEKRGSFMGMSSFDNEVIIPIQQFLIGYWRNPDFEIQIKIASLDVLDDARENLVGLMRKIRHNAPGAPNDFSVNQQEQIVERFYEETAIIAGVGLIITSLSLFVGGIGIMNIMFVSVAERTREIGVRKALGARHRTILLQFLTEAAMICALGGVIGLAIAWIIARIESNVFPFPVTMSGTVMALAIVVSVITGIVSGFLPAWRAARMNPVDALRNE